MTSIQYEAGKMLSTDAERSFHGMTALLFGYPQ